MAMRPTPWLPGRTCSREPASVRRSPAGSMAPWQRSAAWPGPDELSGIIMSTSTPASTPTFTSQEVDVTADVVRLVQVLGQRMCTDPYAAIREYVANAYDA